MYLTFWQDNETPAFQMTNHAMQGNETPPLVNRTPSPLVNNEEEREYSPTPGHISHHPISPVTIQNEILNGTITYSSDLEGKDLPKGLQI